jgi:hypothetical protein
MSHFDHPRAPPLLTGIPLCDYCFMHEKMKVGVTEPMKNFNSGEHAHPPFTYFARGEATLATF